MSIRSKQVVQTRKQLNRWAKDLNTNPRADASRIKDWSYGAFIVLDALGEEDLAEQASDLWIDAQLLIARKGDD